EPGDSGAPILSREGKLIGIHFRGVPQFAQGVDVVVDGRSQKIHRFNVALVVPYLMKKYGLAR
ncbi:MAG: hypothetical protein HY075_16070, partial [Deltaproteobacteria bacterium]|nr:hypothetical protein [Deltaproteobacteria bacterium]